MLSAPPRRSMMSYRIAAIDVHKKMLAVVMTDVEGEGEYQFERRKFGATPGNCTYWHNGWCNWRSKKLSWNRPPSTGGRCGERWSCTGDRRAGNGRGPTRSGTLHLCQAKSNHGPRGRKNDF